MIEINDDTRIIDLTVGQLLDLLRQQRTCDMPPAKERQLVRGMHGIAELFNCSYTTAWRIKKSGIIDDAIVQHGRVIICDAMLALELARKNRKKL